ncbi:unnamed protein product [Tuber melanosporum]|uniref:(Perigord truffle) hypothetical protein n=1 Tax=Tuber melanosporum (strain Mel28) TaxID=656061 RepID=D5GKA3_TUBMM|nr:uncharacterized protein GSTUM_00009443001 [Tuber melanosporum]CAZ84946.1 unnamed protein product [Tuber melanosporum]
MFRKIFNYAKLAGPSPPHHTHTACDRVKLCQTKANPTEAFLRASPLLHPFINHHHFIDLPLVTTVPTKLLEYLHTARPHHQYHYRSPCHLHLPHHPIKASINNGQYWNPNKAPQRGPGPRLHSRTNLWPNIPRQTFRRHFPPSSYPPPPPRSPRLTHVK